MTISTEDQREKDRNFVTGDTITPRFPDPHYPELEFDKIYRVTEWGENGFPASRMKSTRWVKLDPPAGYRIIFWGVDLFKHAVSIEPIEVRSATECWTFTENQTKSAKLTALGHSRFAGGCKVTVTDTRTGKVLVTYENGSKVTT